MNNEYEKLKNIYYMLTSFVKKDITKKINMLNNNYNSRYSQVNYIKMMIKYKIS